MASRTGDGRTGTSRSVAEEGYRCFRATACSRAPFVPRRRVLDVTYRLMSPV